MTFWTVGLFHASVLFLAKDVMCCLTSGAAVTSSLSVKLQGINHCTQHISRDGFIRDNAKISLVIYLVFMTETPFSSANSDISIDIWPVTLVTNLDLNQCKTEIFKELLFILFIWTLFSDEFFINSFPMRIPHLYSLCSSVFSIHLYCSRPCWI